MKIMPTLKRLFIAATVDNSAARTKRISSSNTEITEELIHNAQVFTTAENHYELTILYFAKEKIPTTSTDTKTTVSRESLLDGVLVNPLDIREYCHDAVLTGDELAMIIEDNLPETIQQKVTTILVILSDSLPEDSCHELEMGGPDGGRKKLPPKKTQSSYRNESFYSRHVGQLNIY
mmetsp:Transcript_1840/g.1986  ORF Transcript_1840/g.1986 Transcript_1840/m.1986 type:complete len:177 (-) Transcript_1840:104-634(-)